MSLLSQSLSLFPPCPCASPSVPSPLSVSCRRRFLLPSRFILAVGSYFSQPTAILQRYGAPVLLTSKTVCRLTLAGFPRFQIFQREMAVEFLTSKTLDKCPMNWLLTKDLNDGKKPLVWVSLFLCAQTFWLTNSQMAHASEYGKPNMVYETGELFELGIQLSYLLLLLGFLGVGTFFVIRQVLVRRELDLSAKELQEQVRSGDASATEYFELGAVMLRRKFYPAATKYLLQAIEKWDGDDQDLAQVYNALGVSYIRDGKSDKGISQFETAVRLQPGYVTAWNNLGDAYEKKKDYKSALKAFEEVLLFDPNNKVARPRRDALKERAKMYKGVVVKSEER
ncbi:hypothetical protein I3760_16G062600 [Carya illinoinensis]|nr:hypothetical protein I3760_16G062600 [Carya illinoinensis]